MLNSFEFLKSLFGFLKNGSRLVHKHEQIQNIKIIYSEKIEIKCEYIYNLLKFGISKGNISTECIRYIASLIQNISPIIDNNLGIIINKLGLKDSKKESLERIWSEGNEEEYDEDSFIHNMKDWLMNCEKESVPEGDYEY